VVVPAGGDEQLARLVRGPDHRRQLPRGLVARGLGRSDGDAAQNADGHVVDMTTRARISRFDRVAGVVDVDSGLSLDALLRHTIPRGWFVPVTPGTRHVTVGGAIAADIHGKNHHASGSFGGHVREFDLLCADGETRTVRPDSELFWATVGGMGLTGIVLRATIGLIPIETSWMRVDTERATDLDDLLGRLAGADERSPYSVAWIDCLASGGRLGRGVLTCGRHAHPGDLPAGARSTPLRFDPRARLGVPARLPSGLLNRYTVGAFNEVWYRRAPRRRSDEPQPLARFFHPLDGVRRWNRVYGARGFVQYQFVVPFGAERTLRVVVERFARAGAGSFLAVLKRLGPGNAGLLSFPVPGWTLALDLPAAPDTLAMLDPLDELVVAAGGRVYLAKDSRLAAATFSRMYPRLDRFRAVRDRYDPDRIFVSDLARRLNL
jgi:decaprenylphospho-beta-D-ribofuranose 2-oxidase